MVKKWLFTADHRDVLSLLMPYPSKLMKAYPVSPAVGNVRNDSEELIKPFEPPKGLF